MKHISRTVKNIAGDVQYEHVSTGHAAKKFVGGLAYACHYQLSHVPRSTYDLQDRQRYWRRLGDMIRLIGIQGKLHMILKPRSGFRIRVLLLQTPLHFSGLVNSEHAVLDNQASSPGDNDPMGSFRTSLEHMSQFEETEDGLFKASLNKKYALLFDRQVKYMRDMEFQDEISRMKVTHPNVIVLSDKHLFVKNRKKYTRTFKWSFFRKMNTTIRYPPVNYGGQMELVLPQDYGVPDRKLFALMIITPAREQYQVPASKVLALPVGGYDDDEKELVRHQVRFSSVVSECLEVVREEGEDQGGAGTSFGPTTRSKGKGVASAPSGSGGRDSSSSEDDRDENENKINYDKMRDMFAEALDQSRQTAKKEREEEKKEKKENGGDETGMFTSAWAEDQGMLIQPTFDMWFKDMPVSMSSIVSHHSARRYCR